MQCILRIVVLNDATEVETCSWSWFSESQDRQRRAQQQLLHLWLPHTQAQTNTLCCRKLNWERAAPV